MRTRQIKSIFMEVFGANPAARVLDYLLSVYPLDCSIADMAENSQTSRTTLHYDILPDLLKRKVLAVRTVGKLKLYKLDNGNYPTTEQGLQALVAPPAVGTPLKNWRQGGYLEKGKVPKDPWDNDFVYISPGAHGDYDLICHGADGEPGGEGKNKDINSWESD